MALFLVDGDNACGRPCHRSLVTAAGIPAGHTSTEEGDPTGKTHDTRGSWRSRFVTPHCRAKISMQAKSPAAQRTLVALKNCANGPRQRGENPKPLSWPSVYSK